MMRWQIFTFSRFRAFIVVYLRSIWYNNVIVVTLCAEPILCIRLNSFHTPTEGKMIELQKNEIGEMKWKL